ncbi:unnamed protein product, partial [marine sediment metagenome]
MFYGSFCFCQAPISRSKFSVYLTARIPYGTFAGYYNPNIYIDEDAWLIKYS